MRVDLHAKVKTSDGHDAGTVQHVVVDARTKEVDQFVVSTGGLFGHSVLVPRDRLEEAEGDGDAIHLRLTKAELGALPEYFEAHYEPTPLDWAPMGAYGALPSYMPMTGSIGLVGMPIASNVPMGEPAGSPLYDDQNEPSIEKGAAVLDRDLKDVGVVDDVRMDSGTGKITGVVIRVGNALSTTFGGGETTEIARDQIKEIGQSTVYLHQSKDELHHRKPAEGGQ